MRLVSDCIVSFRYYLATQTTTPRVTSVRLSIESRLILDNFPSHGGTYCYTKKMCVLYSLANLQAATECGQNT